jgi:hypothetical protein
VSASTPEKSIAPWPAPATGQLIGSDKIFRAVSLSRFGGSSGWRRLGPRLRRRRLLRLCRILVFRLFLELALHADRDAFVLGAAVLGFLEKAFGRAGVDTHPAVDAGEGVAGPDGGLAVDLDALGRALDFAGAAEDAARNVVHQLAAHLVEGLAHLEGIAPGRLLDHQVSQDVMRHLEHALKPPTFRIFLEPSQRWWSRKTL